MDEGSARRIWIGLVLAIAVSTAGAGGANALYAYVPDLLVVSTEEEADAWLDANEDEIVAGANVTFDAEADLGIQASDAPEDASKPAWNRLHRTAIIMGHHWKQLDRDCDPDAVFALLYLLMTYGVMAHIEEGYFDDAEYLSVITVVFSDLYMDAYDAWHAGDPDEAPLGWQEAFSWGESGQSTVLEDQLLGMNAHINYDLGVAEAAVGTHDPDTGETRKPDMDRINHVIASVYDDAGWWIAHYYGPEEPEGPPPDWGAEPTTLNETALTAVYDWREHAWQNALTIEALADDPAARETYDAYMDQETWTIAQGLQTPKLFGTEDARVAYCESHGGPLGPSA